jgi:sulfur carrier protein ThiS adenylyltransferase
MMPYDKHTVCIGHLFLADLANEAIMNWGGGESMSGWEERYQRQIIAEGFDLEKQTRLSHKRVLVVGLGGVGTAASLYLALAGITTLGLCDQGLVEESNLNRQILYGPQDVGLRKVDVALEALMNFQPALRPMTYLMDVQKDLIGLADPYDLILDCLDNSPARLAVARYADSRSVPVVSAGARDWSGFVATYQLPQTACWGCLYDLPNRREMRPHVGVLGPAAGVAGVWAAARAIRLCTEPEALKKAEYMAFDLRGDAVTRLTFEPRSDCPVCAGKKQSNID